MLDAAMNVSRRSFVTAVALVMLAAAPLAGAAATYTLDAAKSTIGFVGKQDNEPFEGKFGSFQATVVFSPEDLAHGKFDVTVDTRSVDSGDDDRDATVKNEDLLFAQKYPAAHFVSTSFASKGAGQFETTGKLSIRGVTHDMRIPFTFTTGKEGAETVSWLKGQFVIKRLDYGVGQGDWQDTSVAANDVIVKFALRLKPSAAAPSASNTAPARPAAAPVASTPPSAASAPAVASGQKATAADEKKPPCPKKSAQVGT